MPSKRGKGSKRDTPVDPAVEKDPKKPAPSPKKTSSTKTKAGKKSGFVVLIPSSEKESATPLSQATIVSAATSSRAKGVVSGSSKSKSATAPSSKASRKSVTSLPPKGQRKAGTSSSSSGKEQPSVAPTPPPSKRKKFIAPLFPFGVATRTRSKSGFKVSSFSFLFIYCFYFIVLCCVFSFFCLRQGVYKPGRSDDTVVVVEVTFIHLFFFVLFSLWVRSILSNFCCLILPLGS